MALMILSIFVIIVGLITSAIGLAIGKSEDYDALLPIFGGGFIILIGVVFLIISFL